MVDGMIGVMALTALGASLPAEGELGPLQAAFDVLHYDLDLSVDPAHQSIDGTVTVRARLLTPIDQFELDLDDRLHVREVRAGETQLSFTHRAGKLRIDIEPLGEVDEVRLSVVYGGQPRVAPRPPWDGGFTWAKTASGESWIATSCQGEGADLWWPCKDHPSDEPESMDLSITVPTGLIVAANGRLVSTRPRAGGLTTFQWHVSTPINNYGVALNIAPYRRLEESYKSVTGESFPVMFWVLPEHVEEGRKILPQFIEHLRFYEELLGPYPFRADKYGIAETPHLGMEHQTIIAYGNKFAPAPRGFDWLHHHELAHEWWGNLATAADYRDFWIHESFATYAQALYAEKLNGSAGYREYMRSFSDIRNEKPVAPRKSASAQTAYFGGARSAPDNDVYYKGAWVLHGLRWLMGDEPFFRAQRRLAYPDPQVAQTSDGSACHFVSTEDFQRLVKEEHGASLDWFFEVYLRQPHLPRLLSERSDDGLQLRWEVPGDLPFPMPVELAVDGVLQRYEVPSGGVRVELGAGQQAQIDPHGWLLKKD
ncbi:MAG: aminopeptidase N [Chlamydiales bacterium]|jgi:aminopeptidase N